MNTQPRTIFVCSCEETMPLDLAAIAAANPGATVKSGNQLCIGELHRVTQDAAATGLTIACTYQAPVFDMALEDAGRQAPPTYVNIREMAGWSDEAKAAGPKMAALLAVSALPATEPEVVTLASEGVAILYGRDEAALAVAERLADTLDLTILLHGQAALTPPETFDVPIFRGTIRNATGSLGIFTLTVDDFAAPMPSSRGALKFGAARKGATSECEIIIDISGTSPLFPAHDLRPGYLRADPSSPAAIEKLIADARDLIGEFDKPRYVDFRADFCAHSRNRITGCTRCLDICPTGAISPAGDSVAIDDTICAGCGGCSAVCPTGAAGYAIPPADVAMQSLRALLHGYAAAGGQKPVVLFHDEAHGGALIHALAQHGPGLPANVLPMAVNETTQIGLEYLTAAAAYGAVAVRVLTRARPLHDILPLERTIALSTTIFHALGLAEDAAIVIQTDDPDALGNALRAIKTGASVGKIASFLPVGSKRQVQRLALRELHAAAPQPVQTIALPQGAPMGRVIVETEGCTLCHACVSACPAQALQANPDKPELRFSEDLCVQCGICAKTCPEKVISLEPRLDFAAIDAPPVLLKEEEPNACERCGKEFGTRATVARIREKLAGKHWMFTGANADRLAMIGLCDDCRVIVATTNSVDPYAGPERPKVRTTEDYIAERAKRENGGEN